MSWVGGTDDTGAAVVGTVAVVATNGAGFLWHPAAHLAAVGEIASTFTFVPELARLRVERTTTRTSFTDLEPRRDTARRRGVGEYWSTVRTRTPFTSTAILPFAGPATYQSANERRPTLNTAEAPVPLAVWNSPPCAVRLFDEIHVDARLGEPASGRIAARSGVDAPTGDPVHADNDINAVAMTTALLVLMRAHGIGRTDGLLVGG